MENKKIKILAIDDNRDNLITLKAIISEVIPESIVYVEISGQGGIESARKNEPDVILLDIIMPGMDGYEVCRILKADEELSDIPIIFVTALNGEKQSRIMALEAGGEAFLSKPLDSTELKAQILAMLKIKEAAKFKRDEKLLLEDLIQKRTEELKNANIASLNLLEDLNAENEIRKKSEVALRESEKQFAFLAGTAFDLIKFNSTQKIYEYTARKLFELLEDKGIVAIVEYDTYSDRWKMKHFEGIQNKLDELAKIIGFDVSN
jgi:CheY-like chemotaxis protein